MVFLIITEGSVSSTAPTEEIWTHPSKIQTLWSSHRGSAEMNLTSSHEDTGSIPSLAQWVKDPALQWAGVAVAVAGDYSSDSTPRLETSICHRFSPKKTKKKKKYKCKYFSTQKVTLENVSYKLTHAPMVYHLYRVTHYRLVWSDKMGTKPSIHQ